MGVPHAEHLPRSASQLSTGMFSYQRIRCPHCRQRERGTIRLNGSAVAGSLPASSAHSSAHWRSSIFGKPVDHDVEEAADEQPEDAGERGVQPRRHQHQTTWPSLKIGRYIDTTMPPMMVPRNTMMIGSIRLDRPATMSSTSAS